MSIARNAFAGLQKIGKALMLPVSVLPVAGILLGVGSAKFTWLPAVLSTIMAQAGGVIFSNLPLLFAIGVALGLCENDGVAALSATVGHVVLLASLGVMAGLRGMATKEIMGIQSLDTGVFGGILVGALAAAMFRRFYRIELPPYLGFFAGKRFVPIVTAAGALLLGVILSVLWPPIGKVIRLFSNWAAYGNPTVSVTLYGVVERLLIPFGLHHIWNVPFFFEAGSFTTAAGEVVHGDIHRFFAGDPTAGILGGAFLFKMFGLPAAAIAMWHTARPERRAAVGGIMASAALTSFLTGITEPIEFSFMFLAPALYGLHALLAGGCQALFSVLGAKLGFTFSHGFIDYVLYYSKDTKPWLVLVVGPLVAALYYGLFRFVITRWNLATPGREPESTATTSLAAGSSEFELLLAHALGGRSNIASLDACITRLRVAVHEIALVDRPALMAMGASGVMVVGNGIQAIFGTRSENMKTDLQAYLNGAGAEADLDETVRNARLSGDGSSSAEGSPSPGAPQATGRVTELAQAILEAMGDVPLTRIEAVAHTRLRVLHGEASSLPEAALLHAGVKAVHTVSDGVTHLVVGADAIACAPILEKLRAQRR